MHLPEGILPLSHAAAYTAIAAPMVVWSMVGLRRELKEGTPKRRALIGFGGALLFALTLFPLPLPPLGFSIHLCAAPLLAILLGLRPVIALTTLSLIAQLFLAAHGGFTTLGANILTLGIIGPALALGLYKLLEPLTRRASMVGVCCALGSLAVYACNIGILVLALGAIADDQAFMATLLAGLAMLIVPLALAEGTLSTFLYRSLRQRILPEEDQSKPHKNLKTAVTGAAIFLAIMMLPKTGVTHGAGDGHHHGDHHHGDDHHGHSTHADASHDHHHSHGDGLEGFDHLIFETAAEQAGLLIIPFDLLGPTLREPVFYASIFGCGCLVGWTWSRLSQRGRR